LAVFTYPESRKSIAAKTHPTTDITISGQNQQGMRYQADLTISGIAPEQKALVQTAWEVAPVGWVARSKT
jgi:hypothetical protein